MRSLVMEWLSVAKNTLDMNPQEALLIVVLATICALALRKAILGQRTQQWPPGPPALPIIGHLHLLGDLPHRSLHKLSEAYGPLMGLRLGSVPTIVASSPEMAREILQIHDLVFANRPRFTAAVHICFDCSDAAYSPYGPHWKLLRQVYATELFSAKRLDSFRHVREDEVRGLLRTLQRAAHQPLELRPSLVATSNNIICRMLMGKTMSRISANKTTSQHSNLDLLSLVSEILYLLGVFYVGDYIPWLAWLDPQGYLKRMKIVAKTTKVVLEDIINTRRESKRRERQQGQEKDTPPQDLLDVLLAASQNKDLDIKMSDNDIMAAILDLFVAGSDTSSMTVEWALADLMNNPKVLKKLQEELDNVVGRSRLVEESDIANLPYLGLVVKESMRLHPLVPFLIPRKSTQECYIAGYRIPPKTQAYVNTWAIMRSCSIWDRPNEFFPERFDHQKIDLKGKNFEFLPFGFGRRKCPGWALGFVNVHLMLASLVQAFTWDFPSSSNVIDMFEKFGLVVKMAKPLCAIPTPRLPLHLYKGESP